MYIPRQTCLKLNISLVFIILSYKVFLHMRFCYRYGYVVFNVQCILLQLIHVFLLINKFVFLKMIVGQSKKGFLSWVQFFLYKWANQLSRVLDKQ